MTVSIPIDIKRCILEGIEPPDDTVTYGTSIIRSSIRRNVPLANLSARSRAMLSEESLGWTHSGLAETCYCLQNLPGFPLLMPDDDFAAAINEYAAKWGTSISGNQIEAPTSIGIDLRGKE